jgi:chemotaxis protein CheD
MNKNEQELIFLHPSAMVVSSDPKWIITILGSCVAVCLFDRKRAIGGINHFMLPYWNGDGLETPKYGNVAINQLFLKMLDLGAKKEDIACKIFGGGEVLGEQNSVYNVGKRNIELAFKQVGEMGIRIESSSTGGKLGRKIYFNSATGEVLQKYLLKPTQNDTKN